MEETVEPRETPDFNVLLREQRARAGLTQEELAARSGLSDRAIRDLERGRVRQPRRATLDLLVAALGLRGEEARRFRAVARKGTTAAASTGVALPTPAQLPADVPGFVGRADHVERLTRLLTGHDRSVRVAILSGIGGAGKTALAVHVAHAVRQAFPDGQLYADLRGTDPLPASAGEVLGGFLRALGVVEQAIPASIDERAACYRTMLARRRVVVVLDNARDATQVRPLLPGSSTCAALVTSRRRLPDLDGALPVEVGELDDADAIELLAASAGASRVAADPQAATELITACGRLPLAVRVAGARLAGRPSWPVRTLADRLAAEHRRLDELQLGDLAVRASFQVSYRLLPEGGSEPARAFRLLGWLEAADIEVAAAAAALGAPVTVAEPTLECLVDARLLETPRPGRYRFHDLMRLFARELAEREDAAPQRVAALTRLVRHYLAELQQVNRLVRPSRLAPCEDLPARPRPRGDHAAAAAWVEAEEPNLVAATAQAATTPGVPARLVGCLVVHLGGHLQARGRWEERERLGALAAAVGRRDGDRIIEAWGEQELGTVARNRFESEAARRRFTRALGAHRAGGDAVGEARALANLGAVAHQRGDIATAVDYFEQGLRVCRAHGIRHGEATMLSNLGVVYRVGGRFVDAARCGEQALTIMRESGDLEGAAIALNNLARLHRRQDRFAEALACVRESLRLSRTIANRAHEADALVGLGASYRGLGRLREAVRRCEQGLAIYRELGDVYWQARALQELGEAFDSLGDVTSATAAWREALHIFERLGAWEAEGVRGMLERDRQLHSSSW